jgi:hypothetical protein
VHTHALGGFPPIESTDGPCLGRIVTSIQQILTLSNNAANSAEAGIATVAKEAADLNI